MLFDRRVDRGQAGRTFDLRFGSLSTLAASPENWLLKTAKNDSADPEFIVWGHSRRKVTPFVRLLAYFLSEGCVYKKDPRWVVIAQEKHNDRMEADARAAGFAVSYWGDDKLAIKNARLGEEWSKFGKSYEKFVPEWVKLLSPETILEFLDAYALGDGSRRINSKLGFPASELRHLHCICAYAGRLGRTCATCREGGQLPSIGQGRYGHTHHNGDTRRTTIVGPCRY